MPAAQTLRDIAHAILEALGYAAGFRVYVAARRQSGDALSDSTRWTVIAAAAVGAVVGSKILYWAEHPAATAANWLNPVYLMGGKTIVGGLVGGLIAVEIVKWIVGERRSSGDLFAVPLCVGMAIGRLGCLIAGPPDGTWGRPTAFVLGIDGGDGVRRHCLPLYEIAWLALLAVALSGMRARTERSGDVFRAFMVGYLAFRLAIESLKDDPAWAGLTAIQWACVATLMYYARDLPRLAAAARRRPAPAAGAIEEEATR